MSTIRKKSPIHENAAANITCDFGDGDISRFRSRLPHGHTVSSIIVRCCILWGYQGFISKQHPLDRRFNIQGILIGGEINEEYSTFLLKFKEFPGIGNTFQGGFKEIRRATPSNLLPHKITVQKFTKDKNAYNLHAMYKVASM